MNLQDNPVYQKHKDLLFATDDTGVNHCCHVFGSVIFFQGKLRKQYVLSGELDVSLLKKNNFGLLDALGDDGSLTSFMMREGVSFPVVEENVLLFPKPYQTPPITAGQIQAWVENNTSLLRCKVMWQDDASTCNVVGFVDHIEDLIVKGKVFDMEGHRLTLGQDNGLTQTLKAGRQAFLEKEALTDSVSSKLSSTDTTTIGRKM